MVNLPEDLTAMIAHLESCYPNEGCGVLLQGPGGWRVRPLANVYDREHARDPVRFPRTARTAYTFDPKEFMTVSDEADRNGERVATIVHSHADVGAYFSQEDREMAAPDGEPLFPDLNYLVVAVDKGRASAAKLFWWKDGRFEEASVEITSLIHKLST